MLVYMVPKSMNAIQTPIMKKPAIVLYTTPAIGHLTPMIEFGKLVVLRCPLLSVHVLLVTPPVDAGSGTTHSISFLSSSAPLITFHYLPPPPTLTPDSSASFEFLIFESLRLTNPNLRLSLESISKTHLIDALVADFFCACASTVARDLRIPFYFFFPSGGGGLALFLHLSILHDSTNHDHGSEKDKSEPLHIPGLPPMSLHDFPEPCQDRNSPVYQFILESSREISSSAGAIVNTFGVLEHRALEAIRRGECRLGERIPTFCIGPLISSDNGVNGVDEYRMWLDRQPKRTVVFLCFGSMGVFSEQQLKEIAAGLEMSGQRFLWVVRHPRKTGAIGPGPESDLASLLPEGFLERTKDRGMVVKSWAPQVYILRHESVGGFVTHCGWNSVLEAVCAGVPMVAWPLYAEQRMQKVQLTDEIGIALRLEGENRIVSAKEVETKVRMLMEGEEGDTVRERTRAMRDAAAASTVAGGSSWAAFEELVQSWMRSRPS